MSDLTTLADVKAWLNITSTADDNLLSRLITAASGFISAWLNRTLPLASYSLARSGNGTSRLMLPHYPIQSVLLLTVNGRVIPPSVDNIQPGYGFDDLSIYLVGYRFDRGFNNVAVSFTAGYDPLPADIAQACIELVSLRYKERQRIGEVSKNLQGQVVAYSQKDLPADVATLLAQYRRVHSA